MIKMNEKEFKNYVNNNIKSISSKISLEEINFLSSLVNAFNEICEKYDKSQNNWNKIKKWLEEEKGQWGKDNRCWYESVLDKMQELEQGKDE